jgi:DNA polymerase-1
MNEMKKIIQNEMENAYDIRIPLKVDMGTGLNWFEAH